MAETQEVTCTLTPIALTPVSVYFSLCFCVYVRARGHVCMSVCVRVGVCVRAFPRLSLLKEEPFEGSKV